MSLKRIGKTGEKIAARYLKKKGYRVFAMNVTRAGCEVDLIAKDGDEVVFVEVKTRTSHAMGYPEEAVGDKKRAHIARAAHAWLLENGGLDQPWRVDVVAVTMDREPEIVHFEGI